MTLKVIGVGFGRTGTDSMREALEILGSAPVITCANLGIKGARVSWR